VEWEKKEKVECSREMYKYMVGSKVEDSVRNEF
jgi:hypothetical protein